MIAPASDALELDIDGRLLHAWEQLTPEPEYSAGLVAALLRYAYGQGYSDALTEPVPGMLHTSHGYAVPARRKLDRPSRLQDEP